MISLTFGEQVKIILSRRGMTIKQLAELVEAHTGKPMSRQNMTQRLGRDNFQEQDMRMIAEILGCNFSLSIMDDEVEMTSAEENNSLVREITVGELTDMTETTVEPQEMDATEETEVLEVSEEASQNVADDAEAKERELLKKGVRGYYSKKDGLELQNKDTDKKAAEKEQEVVGDINPYTGKEYKSNSVRMHPKRIGYVQVYDQEQHKWTDMTEWAFLGYQERKKALLGKDYVPPTYLD